MTTKTKVADRYAMLAAAATADGLAFEAAKRPTAKDCEALSVLIDSHRAGLSFVASDEQTARMDALAAAENSPPAPTPVGALVEALETLDALDGGTSAAVLRKGSAEERAAAIEAKRAEARRRFDTATKATTAHGYALIGAATNDGNRLDNMRAKLAELPEAVRAGACKLAATKLVQPGSQLQADLRALYDEQPKQEKIKPSKEKKERIGGTTPLSDDFESITHAKPTNGGGKLVLKNKKLAGFVGQKFSVETHYHCGKLVVTLTQH